MKKRGIIWIIAIIILLLILTSIFIYSKNKTSSQESKGILNSLSNLFAFFLPDPNDNIFDPFPKPEDPYGDNPSD